MKSRDVLAYMKIAGYHMDQAAFTRLYIENRVSMAAANTAYLDGVRAKESGIKCTCTKCSS